jgi:hypothetical protein
MIVVTTQGAEAPFILVPSPPKALYIITQTLHYNLQCCSPFELIRDESGN